MSNLEEQYKTKIEEYQKEIQEHLSSAGQELQKAEELAEKYKIPFRSHISPITQDYFPESFDLEELAIELNITDLYDNYNSNTEEELAEIVDELFNVSLYASENGSGWEHSAVC